MVRSINDKNFEGLLCTNSKIWTVSQISIIEYELEFELGPKFFLLVHDVLHGKYLWYKFGRPRVHSVRDMNCY